MKSLTLLILTGAAALVLAALPAAATTIPLGQPTVPSDYMVVYNAAGDILGFVQSLEGEAADTLREVNTDLANPAFLGDYYLVYGDGRTVSDIVGVEHAYSVIIVGGKPVIVDHAEFAYVSDPFTLANWIGSGNPFDGVQLGTFRESGDPFSLTSLINPAGKAAGGSAFFFSAGGDRVPDGGSALALLGIALAGVEVLRRKLKAS